MISKERQEKKIFRIIARSGLYLITFIFLTQFLYNGCSKKEAGEGMMSMPPMPVEVAAVQVQEVYDKFEAVGTIEAIEAITVVAEIDATVKRLPFREGSTVRKGELIAQLDDLQLAAEVDRAAALSSQFQANYERIKSVVEQKAGAPQDLDDAAAALKVAEANLDVARARFAKTRITAPFAGLIGSRRVSVGSFVRAGQAITEMANINAMRVNFSTPERYLSKLRQGAAVTVSTTAFPDYELAGKIIVIDPILDSTTRSAGVVAELKNPGQKFRPGMSANVSAVLSARPEAITIPNEAIFGSGNQSFVYVIKPDSTVVRTALTLGIRLANIVEIVGGLEPDMMVVRAGHQKLFDGAKVMPIVSQNDKTEKIQTN
jgi:membrane fusion protein (multidrug efflux system)